jgi:hypothetical protein
MPTLARGTVTRNVLSATDHPFQIALSVPGLRPIIIVASRDGLLSVVSSFGIFGSS